MVIKTLTKLDLLKSKKRSKKMYEFKIMKRTSLTLELEAETQAMPLRVTFTLIGKKGIECSNPYDFKKGYFKHGANFYEIEKFMRGGDVPLCTITAGKKEYAFNSWEPKDALRDTIGSLPEPRRGCYVVPEEFVTEKVTKFLEETEKLENPNYFELLEMLGEKPKIYDDDLPSCEEDLI
jgi:hypothetical protein